MTEIRPKIPAEPLGLQMKQTCCQTAQRQRFSELKKAPGNPTEKSEIFQSSKVMKNHRKSSKKSLKKSYGRPLLETKNTAPLADPVGQRPEAWSTCFRESQDFGFPMMFQDRMERMESMCYIFS